MSILGFMCGFVMTGQDLRLIASLAFLAKSIVCSSTMTDQDEITRIAKIQPYSFGGINNLFETNYMTIEH